MDSDEDIDDSFFTAIDQLVAQHQTKQTQPQHQRGSQPSSPLPPPAAAAPPPAAVGAAARPPPAHLRPAGLFQQPAVPLQQLNGFGQPPSGSSYAGAHPHKPPLGPPGRMAPPGRQLGPPLPAAAAHGFSNGGARPIGSGPAFVASARIPQASAQMQQQQQQQALPPPQQHWQNGSAPLAAAAAVAEPAARPQQWEEERRALLEQLNRSEGQNKLLQSNVKELRRTHGELQQQLQQALASSGQGGGAAAGAQARQAPPPAAAAVTFQVGELQKQMESLRQQLLFKEQELEDLKRQHSKQTERLRHVDAQLKQQQQQRQQAGAAELAAPVAEPGSAPQEQQQDRRRSAGQASASSAPAQRSSGQKRRQSAGASGAAAVTAAADAAAGGSAAAAAAVAVPPLLDPAVLAAASSLSSSTNLVAQLLAACSSSMALLAGAGASSGASAGNASLPAAPEAAGPASTALLLRSRLAAAAQAPDAESLQFVASFSQCMQQVACCMLPPAALLDRIGGMVAASMTQLAAASSSSSSSGIGSGSGSGSGCGCSLPPQRMELIAAGLDVAQHLIAQDAGCQQAALGAGGSSQGSRHRLSSRVCLSGPGMGVATAAGRQSAAASSTALSLPATAQAVQQQPAAFAALSSCAGGGSWSSLLPVLLSAALWLGQQHEAVAAGALGCLLEMARALQGGGARAALEPVFTSGAMEAFMQPPALRLQALCLLHLLLEEPALARLFEGSLAQAAAARSEPGPPTATAATGGSGGREGAGGSSTPGREGAVPAAVAAGGVQPMQIEGQADGEAGPWLGAAIIAERLLDSLVLEEGSGAAAPAAPHPGSSSGASGSGSASSLASGGGAGGTAVARAAMQLVAMLREKRQHGILVSLLLDDAFGAPGCMLAQRLVQLAEAATAQPGEEASLLLLCPAQWPTGGDNGGSSHGSSSNTLLQQQAAWQQRLQVAQEALTLLRGLLVDDSCTVAAMDDLVTIPAAARLTLTTLSRLSRLEAPPQQQPPGAAALSPPLLLLAAWARAIGSSTDQPSISEGPGSSGSAASSSSSSLPQCGVEDVAYMAKSLRRRVLARMQQSSMVQG